MATKAAPETTNIERDLETFGNELKYYEVSFSDIVNHPTYIQWADQKWDKRELNEEVGQLDEKFLHISYPLVPKDLLNTILYEMGLDIQENVEYQNLIHRNFSNKIVKCPRWVGLQRTDDAWKSFINKLCGRK